MKKGTEYELIATDVAMYLRSPFQLYCKYFGDPSERDPIPDQYLEKLAEIGKKHEVDINKELFPDTIPVSFDTPEEGFRAVIESMKGGTLVFLGAPLYYKPDGMYGVIDQLVKVDGKSVFGNYHYIIKEIKSAKNIKTPHILQAAFYNYIIGKIQGNIPDTFYIINMDGVEMPFAFADYKEILFQAVQRVVEIRKGVMPSPTFGSCGYPWDAYCNKMALESRDISLINGIGLEKKKMLAENGIKSIDDVMKWGEKRLVGIDKIGEKTAQKYVVSAKAITTKKVIRKSKRIILPEKTTEIFLDLEGLDIFTTNILEGNPTDYLIGVWLRKGGQEEYISFVAKDHESEEEMLNEFIDWIKKQEDYIIYHWHHYEKTHLSKMMEKYGTPQKDRDKILSKDILVDLYKVTTEQFAFPFPGTGLKTIARWMGFNWEHSDVGAMSSIDLYCRYVNEADTDALGLVLDYNKDDCEATKIVKDWLVEQA